MIFWLILFPVLCVAYAVYYIWVLHPTASHTGLDVRLVAIPLVLCVLIGLWKSLKKSRVFLIAVVLNIAAALFFVGLDHYNVMMDIERWYGKGMPERWAKSPRDKWSEEYAQQPPE